MSQSQQNELTDDLELNEVPQEIFLLGLLRAYAEKNGLSQSVLTTQFDPLAAQMLMMIDPEPLTSDAESVTH